VVAGVIVDISMSLDGFVAGPGQPERGAGSVTLEQVRPPAAYRLYRATVTEHSVICLSDAGRPCPLHAIAADHRTGVTP